MTKIATIFAAFTLLGLAASTAFAAGVTKTWVSSTTGNDTGTCQFTSPCKTFAYAITQTAPGGEIDVKDGGSYGPVTITQAVSIVSKGALAAIAVSSGNIGVLVNAGTSDRVILQGLVIDGHGVGADGIVYGGGGTLTVAQCDVRNVTGVGITMDTNAQSLQVVDTTVSNSGAGIYVSVTGLNAALTNDKIYDNNKGIEDTNNSFVTVIGSALSGNAYGVYTDSSGNAQVYLGQSAITGNQQYGIDVEGGLVYSFGDNYIKANVNDLKGTLGSAARR